MAAVDVGILNLTRYAPPNPVAYFFGQKALGVEIRDLYGYLIDGMQGTRGAIRSGGDGAGGELAEGARRRRRRSRSIPGWCKVGPDGTASVTFAMPAFNGTVRVMVDRLERAPASAARPPT